MSREFWNEIAGPRWVEQQVQLDAIMAGHLEDLVSAAGFVAGQSVVDVGCGCGALSLAAAARGCRVCGVDISRPMLARARERAAADGLEIHFEEEDAQRHALPAGSIDRAVSRFGVMFFANPVAAFGNIRGWLAPGGALHFLCWQPLGENPWMDKVLGVAKPWLEEPSPEPDAPGPFALGDPARLRRILADAGFDEVRLAECRRPMRLEGTPEEAMAFYLERGPIKAARAVSEAARAAVEEDLLALMRAEHDGGAVSMGGASWLVSAR